MSINTLKNSSLIGKLSSRLRLNLILLALEYLYRKIFSSSMKIFYPYRYETISEHPFFTSMYDHSPIIYSNLTEARGIHWVTSPRFIDDRPFILEPVDHPLSPTVEFEPVEAISNMWKASRIYSSTKCKKIILVSNGQKELFKKYFPSIISKTIVIRPGIYPNTSEADLNIKYENIRNLKFICIASDYELKGVDLIISAFRKLYDNNCKCELTLVCANIPKSIKQLLPINVKLINLPLLGFTAKVKKSILLKRSHINIVFSHTDTTAALMESLSYGLPIICLRNQHSRDYVENNSGIEIEVPYYLYDNGYGDKWRTMLDYKNMLISDKKNGMFKDTVNSLYQTVYDLSTHPDKVRSMVFNAVELRDKKFSLQLRNNKLVKIYKSLETT